MVQPSSAPISIRPGDERLARVDAYAAEHGLSRHQAILVLLDGGLGAVTTVPMPPPRAWASPAWAVRQQGLGGRCPSALSALNQAQGSKGGKRT